MRGAGTGRAGDDLTHQSRAHARSRRGADGTTVVARCAGQPNPDGTLVEVMGRYSNFAGVSIDPTSLTFDRRLDQDSAGETHSRFPKLGPDDLQGVADDYSAGMPVDAIAAKYFVSRSTIRSRINSLRLVRRLPRLTVQERSAIVSRFAEGESKSALAISFGVSLDTISRTIRVAKTLE